ncbi:MAG: NADH-quinone oxidoreductase subunit M [Puniceicoccales bacterium]|jgi:NADH-quinone oxidoreductase subunit M|nr:NADH-quinone oxidoreductase subunit M [Puniceicoccales bacterium]
MSLFPCFPATLASCSPLAAGGAAAVFAVAPFALVALPVLGALGLTLWPGPSQKAARRTGLVFSFSTLAVLVFLAAWAALADGGGGGGGAAPSPAPMGENPGASPLLGGISFRLALGGPALLLVALAGIIAPMALGASREAGRGRLFNILFLLMQGATLGVFVAQNFFFWFLFWELSLFPAFFLLKLWGGAGAARAAYQFALYTVGGSALMLLSFAAIYAATGTWDFSALAHVDAAGAVAGKFGDPAVWLVFGGVLLGLAVKVPMFPFHTWLPDAYAEAPTGVSMFLTAVMAKMGLYGFFQLLPGLFPRQLSAAAPVLIWLALANVVLGAYAAIRQRDLKRMVAYSSVNHLGYCLLALFAVARVSPAFPAGFSAGLPWEGAGAALGRGAHFAFGGAWLQMFNHGLSAAALFFCVGILADRAGGARGIGDFGGVRKVAPVFAALCGFSMFSSLGLPGLNGFFGEYMVFRGVFAFAPWAAAVATLGLLGTALFLLTFWQKVFHGPAGANTAAVSDLTVRERLILAPVVVLMVLLGVWPQLLLDGLRALPPAAAW